MSEIDESVPAQEQMSSEEKKSHVEKEEDAQLNESISVQSQIEAQDIEQNIEQDIEPLDVPMEVAFSEAQLVTEGQAEEGQAEEGQAEDDPTVGITLSPPEEVKGSLLVSANEHETRVAYLVDGAPKEFFFDRNQETSHIGNIYKGRVLRVLPGMQAAFIDIGLKQAAFLYVNDIALDRKNTFSTVMGSEYTNSVDIDHPQANIQALLQEGQELMVQVSKDPISTKGARVTNNISIAGRHLVYIPTMEHIGVSRRIGDEAERTRLREILEVLVPQGGGFVARTAAEDSTFEELREDLNFLLQIWNEVLSRMESRPAPTALYEDLDLPLKAVRDLVTPTLKEIVVDYVPLYERLQTFVSRFMPEYLECLRLYEPDEDRLFDVYGVEAEINRALSRKVWLPSGGYLIIDQTEALTSIDVNSGRFVGKYHFEETIYRTNMEAIEELVNQLQLRNLGGLIIIDLIDMERASMRDRVYTALLDALKQDRAKTQVTKISEFGLIEMTRKRVRDSLLRSLCDPCIYCQGSGYLKSSQSIAHTIFRDVIQNAHRIVHPHLTLIVHPNIADCFDSQAQNLLSDLESRLSVEIKLVADAQLHLEDFRFMSMPTEMADSP